MSSTASASSFLERALDPYGMMTPVLHAQLAWLAHPRELADLGAQFAGLALELQRHAWLRAAGLPSADPVEPHPDDQRFADPVWREHVAWDLLKEGYLAFTHHVQDALYRTPGLSEKQRRQAAFWWRKWLNAAAPTNFLWTNPVALRKAVETGGASLAAGWRNFLADFEAGTVRLTDPRDFHVGKDLATAPGAVVFRNRLLEVIHYRATRDRVHRIPVAIATPWINKFYILDLAEGRSLVRFLLDRGFDVYIASWKNPTPEMRDVTFDAYIEDGIAKLVETASRVSGSGEVHAVGYCLGGTALAMYLAWANARAAPLHAPVPHWTLFTTLVDFASPGDIEVFLDESTVAHLAEAMARKGYLDGKEMAAAFRLLRSNSLIWQYVVRGWLYGEAPRPLDVLFWNMDTTRMPAAMHTWYLRELYLANRLVEPDALAIAGTPIDLGRIAQPLYAVGCQDDHIAPWKQTFRIANFAAGPKRYVRSSAGHVLGIVNPPVTPAKRSFRAGEARITDTVESWLARTTETPGSWWEDWVAWLAPLCGEMVPARPVATASHPALAAAPGAYVLET
ncbi:MAG: hypothetical protein N2544_05015 [Burkholderiales bacterium]|nr:hypothetical protein [Burkholderiales bacterium]